MPGSSNDVIPDPGKKDRVKGMSYLVKGVEKVWLGYAWSCEHGRDRRLCRECGGSSLCVHDKRKVRCRECGGSSYCLHDKQKAQCRECGGSSLCVHDKRKSRCRECGGSSICEHDKLKSRCRECGGSDFCEHGKQKTHCRECGGSAYCVHDKLKAYCRECGGSSLCSRCLYWCGSIRPIGDGKSVRMCSDCFYKTYPDLKQVPSRYKRKQHYLHQILVENYGENFFEYDREIEGGCSGKEPDWFRDLYTHCLNIECDENQHKPQQSCDLVRLGQLWDCAYRPYVTIRFNPDKYIDSCGVKHKGCFEFDEKNILQVDEEEFERRVEILLEVIDHYLQTVPEETTPVEYLFFDDFEN